MKNFLLSLILKCNGTDIFKSYKKVLSNYKLSEKELLELQGKKLETILFHSWENVPYYKKILEESKVISKDGKVDLVNFKNIPILNKDIIREKFDNLSMFNVEYPFV